MTTPTTGCPACSFGDVTSTGLLTEQRYELFRCGRCRTEFYVDTSPAASDGDSHYWESYKFDVYADAAVRTGFEQRYALMLDRAVDVAGPIQSVLDLGCGIGNFVSFAQGRGLNAVGIDVEPEAVAEARRRGLQAHLAADLDEAVADEAMDAMTMWDVIEHLIDPKSVLVSGLSKVRRGGALLFETPDGAFPVRSVLLAANRFSRGKIDLTGPMYYWEHKIYFTEPGIRALLDAAGADVVSVQRATSLREKMDRGFAAGAEQGSTTSRVLKRAWPALEAGFRRAGRGNKLLVIARKR